MTALRRDAAILISAAAVIAVTILTVMALIRQSPQSGWARPAVIHWRCLVSWSWARRLVSY